MSDIVDDLKAPNLFCGSLRKRAADEIEELRGRLLAKDVVIKHRNKTIDEQVEYNRHLNDHVARLRKRLGNVREALGID